MLIWSNHELLFFVDSKDQFSYLHLHNIYLSALYSPPPKNIVDIRQNLKINWCISTIKAIQSRCFHIKLSLSHCIDSPQNVRIARAKFFNTIRMKNIIISVSLLILNIMTIQFSDIIRCRSRSGYWNYLHHTLVLSYSAFNIELKNYNTQYLVPLQFHPVNFFLLSRGHGPC